MNQVWIVFENGAIRGIFDTQAKAEEFSIKLIHQINNTSQTVDYEVFEVK